MPTEQTPTPRPKRTTTKTASKPIAATTAVPASVAAPAPAATTTATAKPAAAAPAKATTVKKTAATTQSGKSTSAKAAKLPGAPPSDRAAAMIDPEYRRALIAEAAYLRAERRHFAPGYEAEDWLNAESEIDTRLTLGAVSRTR